jgi:hypothetical protein
MQIDVSDEQQENGFSSIRVSFDPDSNSKDDSDQQLQKQLLQMIATEAGIKIDFNDEQFENAQSAIRVRFEPDSNVKVSIQLQP